MAELSFQLPAGHGIVASLDDKGVLTFVISAGEGSPIRGTELFDLMMRSMGDDVQAIHGNWNIGVDGKESTNIDKVNELTSQGIALDQAVLSAWTVTRAARWGFTKVSIEGTPQATAGEFTKIEVRIEKEPE
jgi:hypothetical protein